MTNFWIIIVRYFKISVNISYYASGYHRNSGPLKQQVTLLLLIASSSFEPSSAGFLFVDTYFHWFTFELSLIIWILFPMKVLNGLTLFLRETKTTLLSVQKVSSKSPFSNSFQISLEILIDKVAAVNTSLRIDKKTLWRWSFRPWSFSKSCMYHNYNIMEMS